MVSTIAALLICNASLAGHHETEQSPNETVAVNWLKAQATGKEETIAYVASNLADDGQILIDKEQKFQQEKGEWEKPESYLVV